MKSQRGYILKSVFLYILLMYHISETCYCYLKSKTQSWIYLRKKQSKRISRISTRINFYYFNKKYREPKWNTTDTSKVISILNPFCFIPLGISSNNRILRCTKCQENTNLIIAMKLAKGPEKKWNKEQNIYTILD